MAELCFSCFSQLRSSGVCPNCGYDPGEDKGKYHAALKPGTVLNGRYILGRVLGQGGFGITYAAQDFETKQRVAVKEYLPTNMASRELTGQVSSFGAQHENFEHGKEGFMEEANALVDLKDNPYIVNVHDFFESNGTAYFVMEYVQGKSLKDYVKMMGGKLGENGANNILLPIMEALEDVHSKGLVHRDIAPDNIIVTADGSAKLIDFGAARYSTGEKSLSLDVILKHGFAPKEQYLRRGRQGAFTDVYAMAVTYYYAVTGKTPPDALQRMEEDELVSPSLFGAKLSPNAEEALMKALELQPADRYQTMGEFARAIKGQREEVLTRGTPNVAPAKTIESQKSAPPAASYIHNHSIPQINSNEENHVIKEEEPKKGLFKAYVTLLVIIILFVGAYFGINYFSAIKAMNEQQFIKAQQYFDKLFIAEELFPTKYKHVKDSILCDYLIGRWEAKGLYFELYKEADGLRADYNLPPKSATGQFSLADNIFSIYDGNGEKEKLFKFTIKDEDTISVYCYKDGSTHTLYRRYRQLHGTNIPSSLGVRTISVVDILTAEYLVAQWELQGKIEKSLIMLMDEYAPEQGGGKLHTIVRGDFVKEVDDWCFSPDRAVGDITILKTVYGYTICYISSISYD